jgi:hypothetical protein
MLSQPAFSSPLINEDLPAGPQLVFTLNNRFFRHQACYSLLPAKIGGQADRVISLCKYKVIDFTSRLPPPPPPPSKSGLKLVCDVNIVLYTETSRLTTLKIMPRNLNEIVRSWRIRPLVSSRRLRSRCLFAVVSQKFPSSLLPSFSAIPGRILTVYSAITESFSLVYCTVRTDLGVFHLPYINKRESIMRLL